MDLKAFYNLDIRDKKSSAQMFNDLVGLLADLIAVKDPALFNEQSVHFLPSVFDHVRSFLHYHGVSCESLLADMPIIDETVSKLIDSQPNYTDSRVAFRKLLRKLYRSVLECKRHIDISMGSGGFYEDFRLIYNPEVSSKEKAIQLLKEALKHIDDEQALTKRSKQKIKEQIEKIIDILKERRTDWIQYFGYLTRTLTLLGALGSAVGGGVSLYSLHKAQEAMNQANTIIQNTSINYSFNQFTQAHNQIFVPTVEFNAVPLNSIHSSLQIPGIPLSGINVESNVGLPEPDRPPEEDQKKE